MQNKLSNDYLSWDERPERYTLLTRKLRQVARLSENVITPEDWEALIPYMEEVYGLVRQESQDHAFKNSEQMDWVGMDCAPEFDFYRSID